MRYSNLQECLKRVAPKSDSLTINLMDGIADAAYHEFYRVYHNIDHIRHGLGMLEEFKHLYTEADKDFIELAWWYHDIIYIPGAKHCEELSAAKLFHDCKLLEMDSVDALRASELVMATDHFNNTKELNSNQKIIHDIDLTILGAEPIVYACYERGIEEEYEHLVPKKEYMKGRLEVLEILLSKDLFLLEEIRDKYQQQAEKNMSNEIRRLNDNLR